MGQTQSTQHGGRAREFSKIEDSEFDFDITKKIKTNEEDPTSAPVGIPGTETLIHVHDDGGSGYIVREERQMKKKIVPVVFRWEYGGKEVYLSGTFNDWKTKVPMTYGGGEFTTIIELPSGTHEFKYLVDGSWIHDPNQTVSDTFDGRNNVITVNESDFDFTEALMKDETAEKEHAASVSSLTRQSPPGSYGQFTPAHGGVHNLSMDKQAAMPPSLPPHLLNVILNKDSDQEDPTMLPVPNHVALNHLYALSIKDSVMTLSGTHRYKRKYVTTVLYKPVILN